MNDPEARAYEPDLERPCWVCNTQPGEALAEPSQLNELCGQTSVISQWVCMDCWDKLKHEKP